MDGKRYASLDWFRLVAAVLVVAIHTAPLSDLSETLDFFVTYCAGRLAVPFFLMLTGYFVNGRTLRAVRRELLWYAGATVCYLPVIVYAGQFPKSLGEAARWLLFDGTYYHLWYFPAAALGLLVLPGGGARPADHGCLSAAGAVASGAPVCKLRLPCRRVRRQLVRACERRTRAARGV